MENAEEVMQLLEEFSKIKPKDIPRELDDYLGYVAKTGDPVYQWTLIKHLFREKLVTVITDFYESTLTVELPPCPNVEPFNYERMKSSLLERFDSFSSAPFTVQRICELLTNPRKEYNRADKYMRAIEKNILVVSTREPGSGKRPLEFDSQSETVLNGIPDIKGILEPGSLLHVPTDLPYLGAPPASNDVTVETTELNPTVNDRLGQDFKSDVTSPESNNEKSWLSHTSNSALAEDAHESQSNLHPETINSEVSLNSGDDDEVRSSKDSNIDVESKLSDENSSTKLISDNLESEQSSEMFIQSCETVLPDSIDSSDSFQVCQEEEQNSKIEKEEIKSESDENEVSSTPENVKTSPLVQEEIEDPADSEAEATDTKKIQDVDIDILPGDEINSTASDTTQTSESCAVTISEISEVKSHELDLECSEITGTIDSPVSPEISNKSLHADEAVDHNITLEVEQPENPDSSNDLCLQDKVIVTENKKPEICVEADSVSETNSELSEEVSEVVENIPQCQSNDETSIVHVENSSEVTSPDLDQATEECVQPLEDSTLAATSVSEVVNEEQFSSAPSANSEINTEVQSSSEVVHEMCDQEQRENTVIQSIPNILPDSQHQIEEISVDPNCETEEEAMDVDDCSNQMMVSEGENEGEPMDQSDQLQS